MSVPLAEQIRKSDTRVHETRGVQDPRAGAASSTRYTVARAHNVLPQGSGAETRTRRKHPWVVSHLTRLPSRKSGSPRKKGRARLRHGKTGTCVCPWPCSPSRVTVFHVHGFRARAGFLLTRPHGRIPPVDGVSPGLCNAARAGHAPEEMLKCACDPAPQWACLQGRVCGRPVTWCVHAHVCAYIALCVG